MPENIRSVWSEDELDQALAALRPAPEPDERDLGEARADLLVAAGARALPAEPPRRRWRASWAAIVGTVAAVVAGVLVVQFIRSDAPGFNPAAERLNIAADRIATVDEPLGPGQYRYIATHAWWMMTANEYNFLSEHLLETWVPADEEQDWLWRQTLTGARQWISGTEANASADGLLSEPPGVEERRAPCGDWYAVDEGRKPCTQPAGWQSPNAEFLSSLPRDTDKLYDRLRTDTAGRGQDKNLEMLVYVADLMRSGLVPADLRAALYRVLGKVPGLRITDEVANLDGKKGTAFGVSAAGQRHELIIDPTTGQFIGERQITEKGWPGVPPGTVTTYTSMTTTVVSGMGLRP